MKNNAGLLSSPNNFYKDVINYRLGCFDNKIEHAKYYSIFVK